MNNYILYPRQMGRTKQFRKMVNDYMVTSLEKQLSEWLKLELKDLSLNEKNMFSIASDNGYSVVGKTNGIYELYLRDELVSSFKPQINFIIYPEEKEKGEE